MEGVYTNARKQLLISSVPAILILHLKRFHQVKGPSFFYIPLPWWWLSNYLSVIVHTNVYFLYEGLVEPLFSSVGKLFARVFF